MRQIRGGAHPRREARTDPLVHTWRERGGWRARAYRLRGVYVWRSEDSSAERVTLGIDRRCAFARAEDGEVLVCRLRCPAWFSLDDALFLGWCWEASAEVCGRRSITGYLHGEALHILPPAPDAPIRRVWLQDGVRSQFSLQGEVLFYRGGRPAGFSLHVALAEGWCRLDHSPMPVLPGPAPGTRPLATPLSHASPEPPGIELAVPTEPHRDASNGFRSLPRQSCSP